MRSRAVRWGTSVLGAGDVCFASAIDGATLLRVPDDGDVAGMAEAAGGLRFLMREAR